MSHRKITALITGYDGFAGPYLAEHLLSRGRRVFGTMFKGLREMPPHPCTEKGRQKRVTVIPIDLVDYEDAFRIVQKAQPDEVYHLAGISHVPTSWDSPRLTFSTNVMGTLNLLEAVRKSGSPSRILVVSSAEVYGKPDPANLPTRESAPLSPDNPYAASKAALDILAHQWSRYPGMHVVRARPFSHTGPGQSPNFVCSGFARQIAAIFLGIAPPVMKVGDLTSRRDFTDVRDVARAYRLILEKGGNGEVYNVCSGKSRSIRSILNILKSFSDKKIKVETDPSKMRLSDVPETRGAGARIRKVTGWEPVIPFSRTLGDLYQYWIKHIQKGI